ncbi:tRNA pseudouridine55 synthase [Seinonella peptonophila]|uniref:tRNA pseudouridine synthase B n=1 Tax=Seinonella peptonophila TaxID=112248 RepID=A0A1M5APY5_9BACL|nr:tRNA pseudouridine(55) synthase TruB [Seinonella peptonophila]SHF32310.1 tRNA pseudouridine55 synthase [Seinonella peptonophila]
MFHGILPVWKPKGCTSHDVVGKIRRWFGQKRVGHTGTLDPEVEGVLPICLGQATRLVEYIQSLPKTYYGTMKLGIATDTEDQTGQTIAQQKVEELDYQQVLKVFAKFTGIIEQIPPMYSAIKIDGKPLYTLARAGKQIQRKARKIELYQFDLLDLRRDAYPEIDFRVTCSKGTYIRTLCVDVGKSLGVPAHMKSLLREKSGPFHLKDCLTFDELEQTVKTDHLDEYIVPLDEVLGNLPCILIPESEMKHVYDGWEILIEDYSGKSPLVRVYSETGEFAAIYRLDEFGMARAEKVFRDVN